jgi:hypothetical protein
MRIGDGLARAAETTRFSKKKEEKNKKNARIPARSGRYQCQLGMAHEVEN